LFFTYLGSYIERRGERKEEERSSIVDIGKMFHDLRGKSTLVLKSKLSLSPQSCQLSPSDL